MTTDTKPTSVTDGVEIPDLLTVDGGEHPLLRRVLFGLGALVCLVLGVVGWLVPVITGVPFYVLGAVLLTKAVPAFGHWINQRERRLDLRYRLWLRPKLRARVKREREQAAADDDAPAQRSGNGPA